MNHQILQPGGWPAPRGYSNGILAQGRQVFVAGQIGWNARAELVSDDFAQQTRQALENVIAVLREAGAAPEHIVRMTWYITDRREYSRCKAAVGAAYREIMGGHYPAMTLIEVSGLLEDGAKVEIEATAIVPEVP
ncbi:MAG: RidA family protein [Candidatus Eremiobacteraeota bacterium]|nr:RidA family protein [Candidatus Eremiobacteraeota bacterium]